MSPYVFADASGKPLNSWVLRRKYQEALDAAGLPRQRFHDIRHTTATLLIEAGEELGVVSRILGHATIGTTMNVYAHLTPAMAQRSPSRLDATLARRRASEDGVWRGV